MIKKLGFGDSLQPWKWHASQMPPQLIVHILAKTNLQQIKETILSFSTSAPNSDSESNRNENIITVGTPLLNNPSSLSMIRTLLAKLR